MWSNLVFGQVNVFVMLALTWDLVRVDRRAAGALVGVVAGVKLTPLIFIVLLVLVGRRRAAVVATTAFGATVAVGFALAPSDSWAYYTEVLWDPGRVGGVAYAGNQSVLAVLTRVVGHEVATTTWLAVAVPLSLAVLLTAAWAWRRGEALWGISLTACAMLLASPISWSHHWVWAVPIVLLVAGLPARVAWPLGSIWVLVFASHALWWPPEGEDREVAWSLWQQLAGNSYAALAVVLAAVKLVHLAWTGRVSTDLLADAGEQGRA
jgi:alpha-1,2-mannosyltransferase